MDSNCEAKCLDGKPLCSTSEEGRSKCRKAKKKCAPSSCSFQECQPKCPSKLSSKCSPISACSQEYSDDDCPKPCDAKPMDSCKKSQPKNCACSGLKDSPPAKACCKPGCSPRMPCLTCSRNGCISYIASKKDCCEPSSWPSCDRPSGKPKTRSKSEARYRTKSPERCEKKPVKRCPKSKNRSKSCVEKCPKKNECAQSSESSEDCSDDPLIVEINDCNPKPTCRKLNGCPCTGCKAVEVKDKRDMTSESACSSKEDSCTEEEEIQEKTKKRPSKCSQSRPAGCRPAGSRNPRASKRPPVNFCDIPDDCPKSRNSLRPKRETKCGCSDCKLQKPKCNNRDSFDNQMMSGMSLNQNYFMPDFQQCETCPQQPTQFYRYNDAGGCGKFQGSFH